MSSVTDRVSFQKLVKIPSLEEYSFSSISFSSHSAQELSCLKIQIQLQAWYPAEAKTKLRQTYRFHALKVSCCLPHAHRLWAFPFINQFQLKQFNKSNTIPTKEH